MQTLADEAALQSALISGFDPRKRYDEKYDAHRQIIADILNCTTGALTHPIIINMTLCGDREDAKYRPGIRAAEAAYLPDAKYARHLFLCWWFFLQRELPLLQHKSEKEKEDWCWKQHDFLICLEPFKSANGRTARIVFYMLLTVLRLPVRIINAEKAVAYYAHKRDYREKEFAPLMREHGYMT